MGWWWENTQNWPWLNHDSIKYLKIYGANCFGNKIEKQSLKARIDWVNSQELNIKNFRNGELIRQAENKILL